MLINECKYRSLGYDKLTRTKHFHNNTIEIVQLVSGSGNYIIHDNMYAMGEGVVYFIDGEKFHSSQPMSDDIYCRSMVSVDKTEINSILTGMGAEDVMAKLLSRVVVYNRKYAMEIDGIFARMCDEYAKGSNFGAALCVVQIIDIMCRSENSFEPAVSRGVVADALEYINSNIARQFTENDICNELHVSQSSLCHKFREQLKMPLMEYVRIQRYLHSRDILKNTDKSIAETAFLCGFGSSSHFCAFFRKMSGQTPAQYRNNFAVSAAKKGFLSINGE
ncbi:MAG: helix-turn-helix transcriptional regulator [Clostridia bacterium]|nr:helix-turn-helix transcriptional regulator [Clostridia bacterium]